MAWSVTFIPLQQRELISLPLCKCHSTFLPFKFRFSSGVSPFSSPKPIFQLNFSLFVAKAQVSSVDMRSSRRNRNTSTETTDLRTSDNNISSEFSSSRSNDKRVDRKLSQSSDSSEVEEGIGIGSVDNGRSRRNLDFKKIGNIASGSSSMRSKDNSSPINSTSARRSEIVNEKPERKSKGGVHYSHEVKQKKSEKGSKKSTADLPEVPLRIRLDMCSKMGDVLCAISLYDSAIRDGVKMGQYHYTVLLYLCSSAAMGVIRPAKSGSGSRSLDMLSPSTNASTMDSDHDDDHDDEVDDYEGDDDVVDVKHQSRKQEAEEILVGEDVKKYALEKGFEIYNKMCVDNVPMNEAALTSVARMAMAMGDGDMAFNMVKQMKELGINPKLRSYGPALSAFCNGGHIEEAFAVEKHMLEHGVHPEEPELETLLRVSVEVGHADKVYHLLHKLRASVRSVSPSTADLIEKWFKSKEASGVGKRIWDHKVIVQMMEKAGGGWHGGGWLGRGKWAVSHTSVEANGLCKCCGEKLALIDLDPEETDRFAESVASIATKREKNSSFQKFQRWLDYYGPFEAVVDAANVGLFSQRRFKPSKVNAVVNGIRQMNPSKKWPLIVLHNKRVTGRKMDEPVNKALIEKWRNADALYATPTGSNDDWYWLYAAVKFKCLIVTNDEMRDHTFQLLGNDFFPKWKERHQVRFSFSDVGSVFHMPPPCSVVIQESERGHWHIPIASNPESEVDRTWLCITRANACIVKQDSKTRREGPEELEVHREQVNPNLRTDHQLQTPSIAHNKQKPEKAACGNLGKILSTLAKSSNCCSILIDIEAAEKLGSCMIDFQI